MYSILAHCTLFLEDCEQILIPTRWNCMTFGYTTGFSLAGTGKCMFLSIQWHKGCSSQRIVSEGGSYITACCKSYVSPGKHKTWEQLQVGCYVLTSSHSLSSSLLFSWWSKLCVDSGIAAVVFHYCHLPTNDLFIVSSYKISFLVTFELSASCSKVRNFCSPFFSSWLHKK